MTDQPEPATVSTVESPPHSIPGILRRLGPGLIIAGSIVGSGELIGTTTTGAQAGYYLLWLIIVGCVIKVFVQVEFGRYAISTGEASMVGMNETPGPAISWTDGHGDPQRVNWLSFYWLLMFLVSLGQLGGIVGGVGQAMAISVPLTQAGRDFNQAAETKSRLVFQQQLTKYAYDTLESKDTPEAQELKTKQQSIQQELAAVEGRLQGTNDQPGLQNSTHDDRYWAIIITVVTAILLVRGKYRFIEWATTVLVAGFTLVTVLNVFMLQVQPEWAVTGSDIALGLSFKLPEKFTEAGKTFYPLATALATFGIIGVGANELIAYPYWCVEKGYARFVGNRDESAGWTERAQGWLRVLRWDAWCSMIVYSFATVAFYLLGAATLGRIHLTPKGNDMIRTLSIMYEPVFGSWTQPVFLFGAFAVLYSTIFVAIAGHARVSGDALRVFGLQQRGTPVSKGAVKFFSGFYPFICLAIYLAYGEPTTLILASGAMQAVMLPMLSFAALYFRYRRVDARIRPGWLWDLFLWLSALGMLIAGGWLALTKIFPALNEWA
jgi:Mn2+/Fe2+ NRAMP family transporter